MHACQSTRRPANGRKRHMKLVRRIPWMIVAVVVFVCLGNAVARGQSVLDEDTPVRTTDLIRLTTSSADAIGELEIAELRLETLEGLRLSVAVANLEIRVAQVNVATAENKVRILRKIAEKEMSLAKAKLDRLRQLWKPDPSEEPGDAKPPVEIVQAEATIDVLQMILDMK